MAHLNKSILIFQAGREGPNTQVVKFAPGLRVAGSSKQLRDHLVHQVSVRKQCDQIGRFFLLFGQLLSLLGNYFWRKIAQI